MPVDLKTAVSVRESFDTWKWVTHDLTDIAKKLGFNSSNDMVENYKFPSGNQYIYFLEGKWAEGTTWDPTSFSDWKEYIGKFYHNGTIVQASDLIKILLRMHGVRCYGDDNNVSYSYSKHDSRGIHLEYSNKTIFDPSPVVVKNLTSQYKKHSKIINDKITRFQETGEIDLSFKDMELYERVQMLEGQSKDQTTVIVGLNDKVANLENELSEQKDQIIAIRYLLELQMEQRTAEIQEAQVANEVLMTKKKEEFEKKISEINTTFLCFFLPSIVILIIAIIVSLYTESKQSAYFTENKTLIMDRSS